MRKYVLIISFMLFLAPAFVVCAQESAAIVNSDGWVTGYFYDPDTGGVAAKIDNFSPAESEDYLDGVEEPTGDGGDGGAAKKPKKDKGNNGIGWGVGGDPKAKLEGDGSPHKE